MSAECCSGGRCPRPPFPCVPMSSSSLLVRLDGTSVCGSYWWRLSLKEPSRYQFRTSRPSDREGGKEREREKERERKESEFDFSGSGKLVVDVWEGEGPAVLVGKQTVVLQPLGHDERTFTVPLLDGNQLSFLLREERRIEDEGDGEGEGEGVGGGERERGRGGEEERGEAIEGNARLEREGVSSLHGATLSSKDGSSRDDDEETRGATKLSRRISWRGDKSHNKSQPDSDSSSDTLDFEMAHRQMTVARRLSEDLDDLRERLAADRAVEEAAEAAAAAEVASQEAADIRARAEDSARKEAEDAKRLAAADPNAERLAANMAE
eukprot:scaffold99419_cov26-Tisochrysis_lutea.AAC.1